MSSFSIAQRRTVFKKLHQTGCFVLPNPWDIGGARMFASMGFKCLATTSSGYAWSTGRADGNVSRAETIDHLRQMVNATELPVNADFESGFGTTLEEVTESVRMAIDTGVAGLSIEDSTGSVVMPLRSIAESADRIRAAKLTIAESGKDVLLIGRAENFFVGRPDLDDTLRRLKAYADAGADCLYAPGIKTADQIKAVVETVAPKPVNVLIGWPSDLTLQDLENLGVRRVSLGGALARAAWGSAQRAARAILQDGKFNGFAGALSGLELNTLFGGGDPQE